MNQAFLLLGPEEGEKALFIEQNTDGIEKRLGEKPELYRFYSFESQVSEITALLRNGSLFSKYKIVILNNAELIKKKDDVSLLVEYLKNPIEAATLFLVSTEYEKEISGAVRRALPASNIKTFWEMFENKKIGWIMNFFHKRNISIERDAADFLLEMIQNNTRDLEQGCSKLVQFFGEGSNLRIETIEKYIYHSREENVFTLFERFAVKDFPACQEVLNKILLSKESDPQVILSGLLWQIRNLLKMKTLIENNYPMGEVFSKLKMRNRKSQRIYTLADKSYSREETQNLVMLISEFTVRLRSVSVEMSYLLLQLFLYYATLRGGRLPESRERLLL